MHHYSFILNSLYCVCIKKTNDQLKENQPDQEMNSEMQKQQLPKICLSRLKLELVGTPEWLKVAEEVVQALENYGSFEVVNDDENTVQLCQKVFEFAMRDLFSLSSETKSCASVYFDKKTFGTPLESLAVLDATAEGFHSFTNLMWPQGNPFFCETMWCYIKKLMELDQIIHRMITEKFGVDQKHYDNFRKHIKYGLRMASYDCSGPNKDEKDQVQAEQEMAVLLPVHTDPTFLTIIGQNQVDGVEVQIKSGEWVRPSPSSFVVFASESCEAWTNGRLEATNHRVVRSGNEETRYSVILASTPMDEFIIQAPQELCDEKHPALYKPFVYADLYQFHFTEAGQKASSMVKAFCGIQESKISK